MGRGRIADVDFKCCVIIGGRGDFRALILIVDIINIIYKYVAGNHSKTLNLLLCLCVKYCNENVFYI